MNSGTVGKGENSMASSLQYNTLQGGSTLPSNSLSLSHTQALGIICELEKSLEFQLFNVYPNKVCGGGEIVIRGRDFRLDDKLVIGNQIAQYQYTDTGTLVAVVPTVELDPKTSGLTVHLLRFKSNGETLSSRCVTLAYENERR